MSNTGQMKRRDAVMILAIPTTNAKRRRGRSGTDKEAGTYVA